MNKIYDERLEIVTYKVKYLNGLLEDSVEYLDHLIKQASKDIRDVADVIALLGSKTGDLLEEVENVRNGITEILTNENHPELQKHPE
jgi:predicted RNA-binding protein with EMAP domain